MKKLKTTSVEDLIPGKLYWWKRNTGSKSLMVFLKSHITNSGEGRQRIIRYNSLIEMTYLYASRNSTRIETYCDNINYMIKNHIFWEAC